MRNEPDTTIVVADIRFTNEAEYIKKLGGLVLRIDRPGLDAGVASEHISETGIPMELIDYVVDNDGDLFDLMSRVSCEWGPLCLGEE